MRGHIIVSGDDALAMTIADELENAGARIVKLVDDTVADTKDDLAEAGIDHAAAVVCAGNDDAMNLEIALLARKANPNVRVVARLANDVLREAVADDNGPGAILDVAELAAPSVVEAALAHTAHPFEVAGIKLLVSGAEAPYDGTLREIYGDLAPVAVIHGKNSPTPGLLETCPARDVHVRAGDWTAMIGTAEELAAQGIRVRAPSTTRVRTRWVRRAVEAVRGLRSDANPMFLRAIAAVLTVLIGSTVLLRYSYQPHAKMTWVDALYFSTETIATVGYGDFSFLSQPTWLRLFSIGLMFGGLITTAVLVAFIADLLISRRFAFTAGRRRARQLRNHVIVVGLGSFGSRVAADLTAAGYEVAVIEIDENNRYLSTAAELGIPVIFGDATLPQTLEAAHVEHARAVTVLTHDDMVNIETGIVLREMLGPRVMPQVVRPDVPIVLRIYDHVLGSAVADRFGFDTVRSTVELAAPWFIGAAMGLHVLGTFSVGQRYFMVGGMHVAPGSELDGLRMFELSTQTRVIVITREDAPVQRRPRRDARLRGGDTVYLVGPYRELLATLRKGRPPQQPEAGRERRLA